MRKTRLVILPGARCLNSIGCLLLFLACPTIAFKGQENREVEPICKAQTLNEIWIKEVPKAEEGGGHSSRMDSNGFGHGIGKGQIMDSCKMKSIRQIDTTRIKDSSSRRVIVDIRGRESNTRRNEARAVDNRRDSRTITTRRIERDSRIPESQRVKNYRDHARTERRTASEERQDAGRQQIVNRIERESRMIETRRAETVGEHSRAERRAASEERRDAERRTERESRVLESRRVENVRYHARTGRRTASEQRRDAGRQEFRRRVEQKSELPASRRVENVRDHARTERRTDSYEQKDGERQEFRRRVERNSRMPESRRVEIAHNLERKERRTSSEERRDAARRIESDVRMPESRRVELVRDHVRIERRSASEERRDAGRQEIGRRIERDSRIPQSRRVETVREQIRTDRRTHSEERRDAGRQEFGIRIDSRSLTPESRRSEATRDPARAERRDAGRQRFDSERRTIRLDEDRLARSERRQHPAERRIFVNREQNLVDRVNTNERLGRELNKRENIRERQIDNDFRRLKRSLSVGNVRRMDERKEPQERSRDMAESTNLRQVIRTGDSSLAQRRFDSSSSDRQHQRVRSAERRMEMREIRGNRNSAAGDVEQMNFRSERILQRRDMNRQELLNEMRKERRMSEQQTRREQRETLSPTRSDERDINRREGRSSRMSEGRESQRRQEKLETPHVSRREHIRLVRAVSVGMSSYAESSRIGANTERVQAVRNEERRQEQMRRSPNEDRTVRQTRREQIDSSHVRRMNERQSQEIPSARRSDTSRNRFTQRDHIRLVRSVDMDAYPESRRFDTNSERMKRLQTVGTEQRIQEQMRHSTNGDRNHRNSRVDTIIGRSRRDEMEGSRIRRMTQRMELDTSLGRTTDTSRSDVTQREHIRMVRSLSVGMVAYPESRGIDDSTEKMRRQQTTGNEQRRQEQNLLMRRSRSEDRNQRNSPSDMTARQIQREEIDSSRVSRRMNERENQEISQTTQIETSRKEVNRREQMRLVRSQSVDMSAHSETRRVDARTERMRRMQTVGNEQRRQEQIRRLENEVSNRRNSQTDRIDQRARREEMSSSSVSERRTPETSLARRSETSRNDITRREHIRLARNVEMNSYQETRRIDTSIESMRRLQMVGNKRRQQAQMHRSANEDRTHRDERGSSRANRWVNDSEKQLGRRREEMDSGRVSRRMNGRETRDLTTARRTETSQKEVTRREHIRLVRSVSVEIGAYPESRRIDVSTDEMRRMQTVRIEQRRLEPMRRSASEGRNHRDTLTVRQTRDMEVLNRERNDHIERRLPSRRSTRLTESLTDKRFEVRRFSDLRNLNDFTEMERFTSERRINKRKIESEHQEDERREGNRRTLSRRFQEWDQQRRFSREANVDGIRDSRLVARMERDERIVARQTMFARRQTSERSVRLMDERQNKFEFTKNQERVTEPKTDARRNDRLSVETIRMIERKTRSAPLVTFDSLKSRTDVTSQWTASDARSARNVAEREIVEPGYTRQVGDHRERRNWNDNARRQLGEFSKREKMIIPMFSGLNYNQNAPKSIIGTWLQFLNPRTEYGSIGGTLLYGGIMCYALLSNVNKVIF